jgi:hypothetical protein
MHFCAHKGNQKDHIHQALLALAHGVGTSLDVLSAQREQPNELVLRELAELREDLKRLARAQSVATTQ